MQKDGFADILEGVPNDFANGAVLRSGISLFDITNPRVKHFSSKI